MTAYIATDMHEEIEHQRGRCHGTSNYARHIVDPLALEPLAIRTERPSLIELHVALHKDAATTLIRGMDLFSSSSRVSLLRTRNEGYLVETTREQKNRVYQVKSTDFSPSQVLHHT